MVTESTRKAVWLALIWSARRGRYYGALANRYQRRDRIIRSLLLAFDGLNRRLLHVMSKDPVPEDERLNQASTEAAYAEMKADYVS